MNTLVKEVTEHAESIKNDQAHVVETMSVGDMWCQGDVGIIFLGDACIENLLDPITFMEMLGANKVAQLAPGDTQGSRHCVEDVTKVRMFRKIGGTSMDGPRIHAPTGFRVNHPEHGDVTLPPGNYCIVYQQVWDQARARRALD